MCGGRVSNDHPFHINSTQYDQTNELDNQNVNIPYFIHAFYCTGTTNGPCSWLGQRSDVENKEVCPAAHSHRYGWSVESGGGLYTPPGVTGIFGASAT